MHNYLRTILLLGVLSIFFIMVGGIVGGQQGLCFAFFISLLINGISYFFSDKIALMASGAKPVNRKQAPELYEAVEDLARKIDLPMPKLYMTSTPQANAFATGRDPNHAS